MGKIIKYEWRKQRTSRFIILFGLLACILALAVGTVFHKDTLAVGSTLAMVLGSFLVIFYTGIESLLIFNKDLRTKQSHMLWMIPKSTYEILGGKFLAAILQMLFVFVAFIAAGLTSAMIIAVSFGEIGMLFDFVQELFRAFFDMNIDWRFVISNLILLFLSWTLVITTGFLAIILSRTLFLHSKFSGLFSIILFLIINYVVERLFYLIGNACFAQRLDVSSFPVMAYALIFYFIVCTGLFFVSGMLADKKLSV